MARLQPLRIVPAGAGSGKTYAIQHLLGDWIAEGTVRPERVVAVTYTEAAAAELRERISLRLLEMGRVEDALRADLAYISTIHAFGLRILREFAFEAGASPQPRLLNEDEESALVRRALARTDKANAVVDELEAFGYRYDFKSGRSAVDAFRGTLLHVLHLFRAVGLTERKRVRILARNAIRGLELNYGPTKDADRLRRELQGRVRDLLKKFPVSMAPKYGRSKLAKKEFVRDFGNLQNAARTDELSRNWRLWQELRQLRRSNRVLQLPRRYDRLAGSVREAACQVVFHPGPLEQECLHLTSLLDAGHDILHHYEDAKRQAGLVDYSDMIAAADRLLRTRPDVLRTLASRVDCLVVDEFQDTNPLQFVLLWRLAEAGIPTVVVGDLKQAIMGFQGADPRLFNALIGNREDDVSELTRNWRSQPKLMEVINKFGALLFGRDYTTLEAKAPESRMMPLEFVRFGVYPRRNGHAVRAHGVGKRLIELLKDPTQTVRDRKSGERRRLRGGDIAVLCPTNAMVATYATVLRILGLRVNHQADGWLSSRAVQIAWHALAYLANPGDRHAALYLAATELGSLTLDEGLRRLARGERIEDPLLLKLDGLAEDLADRTVYALVADTLSALNLFDVVAQWPDSEQARANLVQLMGRASEFMDSNREAMAHGGYHGSGVQTFLAWLDARSREDDGQQEKKVLQDDAVVVRTWHKSKGLEWPIVAVCGLARTIQTSLPHLDCQYSSFSDLSRILDRVRIRYLPRYVSDEKNRAGEVTLQDGAAEEARRLLYVVLTRSREKLILEWPEYLESKERQADKAHCSDTGRAPGTKTAVNWQARRPSYWSLVRGMGRRCALTGRKKLRFVIDDQRFPCHVSPGGVQLPKGFLEAGERAMTELPVTGRRAIQPSPPPADLTPESRTPSEMVGDEEHAPAAGLRFERYGDGLNAEVGLHGLELGSFLHLCFELLGSRPNLSSRLPALTGVELSAAGISAISGAVERFEAWLAAAFEAESVLREWPLLALDDNGTVVSGTADLIIRTPDGVWILDHKSDRVEDPVAGFQKYRTQIQAYVQAVAAQGTTVLGAGINWIRRGEVCLEPAPPSR